MKKEILPPLGEGLDEAVIASWYVRPGSFIQKDDDLVEVVTDKASFNVPAQHAGRIKNILVQEGQTVKIGTPLAVVEETNLPSEVTVAEKVL